MIFRNGVNSIIRQHNHAELMTILQQQTGTAPIKTGELQFTDMEHYGSIGGGWELDYLQLDSGPLNVRTVLYRGEQVFIKYVSYNRRFHQRGVAPRGVLSFGLTDDPFTHVAYGQPLQRDTMIRFNKPDGLDVVAAANFVGFPVSINEKFAFEVAERIGIPLIPQQLSHGPLIYRHAPAIVASLRRDLHALIGLIRNDALALKSPQWIAGFEFSFTAKLLQILVLPHHARTTPQYSSARNLGLKRAVEHVRARQQYPLTIKDLCCAANISWRSLDRAFREQFEMTPKQYLTRHCLHRVRWQLLHNEARESISDIAGNWGFFHPGQFASQYRRCFGELPRQTAKTTATQGVG
jgi:AraC family ethanolamine operon transcriptional activator